RGVGINGVLGKVNDKDAGLIRPVGGHEAAGRQFPAANDTDAFDRIPDSLDVNSIRRTVITDQIEHPTILAQQAWTIIVILGNSRRRSIKRFGVPVRPAAEAE